MSLKAEACNMLRVLKIFNESFSEEVMRITERVFVVKGNKFKHLEKFLR